MPTYEEHEGSTAGLLSWAVVAVHCTHCNQSTPTGGVLDRVWLLAWHGEHLGSVSLDLVVTEPGTKLSSAMRLHLLPLDLQMLSLN